MTDEDGGNKMFSTVKKSYLMKEKIPKPKNAVRILLYLDANNINRGGGNGYLYPAMTGIALTEIFESIGYSVNFITGFDCSQISGILNPNTNQYAQGERFVCFNVKNFSEALNVPEFLHITSSPTMYGYLFFKQMFLTFFKYKDKYQNVGYPASLESYTKAMFSTLLPRDTDKGVIYLIMKHIDSVDDAKKFIEKAVECAEKQNEVYRDIYTNRR
jgi:hypothetical protein